MPPLETALILRAMVVASKLGQKWGGQQEQQNKFAQLLEEYGLKKGGNQKDSNSGGPRTYESQMSLLGLLFKDLDGHLLLTQAGQDLVAFNDTAKTFEYQVLKVQYPSAYSMSKGVGIDKSIKIRPFTFLLKLANDPEINGLSDKDMVIPVVFGKNENCFKECKNLILKMRIHGVESVIPDDERIRTSRTINNNFKQRLEDINDIANTFKNILESSGLVDLKIVDEQIRIFPKIDTISRLPEIDKLPFVDFINLPVDQATFQYGKRIGAIKDTRRIFMPEKAPELLSTSGLIYRKFLDEVNLPVRQTEVDDFTEKMSLEFNIKREQVLLALEPILINTNHYTGSKLIELSRGGLKTAEAFEKIITKIFELDFGFQTEWVGRKYRARTGGYMDVFVVELGRNLCGIIDTKSMNSYDLPHQDSAKAITTYVDAAKELYGSNNLELKFVGYISHLIGDGAKNRAFDIHQAKGVAVSLISAYGLNSMRDSGIYNNNPMAVMDRLSSCPVTLIV
jgi:hypothetical protein